MLSGDKIQVGGFKRMRRRPKRSWMEVIMKNVGDRVGRVKQGISNMNTEKILNYSGFQVSSES